VKKWDFTTGAARLDLALRALQLAWNDAGELWNDETSRAFRDKYLHPLEPRVRRAMDAVQHMAEIFSAAERELDSD
jgi:hypothetical protein